LTSFRKRKQTRSWEAAVTEAAAIAADGSLALPERERQLQDLALTHRLELGTDRVPGTERYLEQLARQKDAGLQGSTGSSS
jgi:hypothetical protein